MRLGPMGLCLLFALPLHLPAAATPACADPALRLNEIMAGPARDWDGSGTFSSRDDEWVEVVNTGATSLALAGFFIADGDSLPRYALSGTLAAGEHLLVTGRQAFEWEQATGNPAFGLSLGNSGDTAMLWQITGPDTVLIDSYTYKSHEAAADRAIGRFPDGSGPWVLFDSLNPYTGTTLPHGNGCAPTPGATNVCASTPVRRATWGAVKSIYR